MRCERPARRDASLGLRACAARLFDPARLAQPAAKWWLPAFPSRRLGRHGASRARAYPSALLRSRGDSIPCARPARPARRATRPPLLRAVYPSLPQARGVETAASTRYGLHPCSLTFPCRWRGPQAARLQAHPGGHEVDRPRGAGAGGDFRSVWGSSARRTRSRPHGCTSPSTFVKQPACPHPQVSLLGYALPRFTGAPMAAPAQGRRGHVPPYLGHDRATGGGGSVQITIRSISSTVTVSAVRS